MSERAEPRSPRARAAWIVAAALGLGLAGCTAAIGAGVVAAGLTVSAFALSCDDAIRVTVWDRASGRTVCDAVVTATDADGDGASFSPCYGSYLGEGTWTVTATKDGYQPATSKVTVTDDEGCHPAIHTVELTLAPLSGAGAIVPPPAVVPEGPSPAGGGVPSGVGGPPPDAPPPAGPSPAVGPQAPGAAPAAPPAPPAGAEVPASPSPPTSAFPAAPAAPPTR